MGNTHSTQTKLPSFQSQTAQNGNNNENAQSAQTAQNNGTVTESRTRSVTAQRSGADAHRSNTQSQCRGCGTVVSDRFIAVFALDADRGVDRCPSCSAWSDIVDGGAAVRDESPGGV